MAHFTLAIHGGSGTLLKSDMSPEQEIAHLEGLDKALQAGYKIIVDGGNAIDAVRAAIIELENNILFNAGRGSVYTKKGQQEMDAAIMDGATMQAGAIAAVRHIRNPIELAMAVMYKSNHVFLSGKGAAEFAAEQGIATESDEYFFSKFRYDQWLSIRNSDDYALDHSRQNIDDLTVEKKMGTVGAVACDQQGNLAAATSTGGMTNKQFGRVGDSPLIGIGTYANNKTCAISCTGHGEPFIRAVAAYDVSCLMEYKGLNLAEAMNMVVRKKLPVLEGEGGMIGVDAKGNASLIFNTDGMYRGIKSNDGTYKIAIYKEI